MTLHIHIQSEQILTALELSTVKSFRSKVLSSESCTRQVHMNSEVVDVETATVRCFRFCMYGS